MYLAIISPSALPSFLHGSSLLPLSFKRITRESAFTLVCFKSFLFLFYSFFCMFWHWFPLFIHSFYLCMQWRCLHFTKRELLTFQSPPLFFFFKLHFFLNSTYTQLLQSKCGTNMKLARPQTKPFSRWWLVIHIDYVCWLEHIWILVLWEASFSIMDSLPTIFGVWCHYLLNVFIQYLFALLHQIRETNIAGRKKQSSLFLFF